MFIMMIILFAIGWVVGVHAPMWVCLVTTCIAWLVSLKQEGLGGIAYIFASCAYTVGVVSSVIIYKADFIAIGDFIKFVFTGG